MKLKPVGNEALSEFQRKSDEIIAQLVNEVLSEMKKSSRYAPDSEEKVTNGLRMMNMMIEPVLLTGEISLLSDQLEWANTRLPNDGVMPEHLYNDLIIYKNVIDSLLDRNSAEEILPYIEWMIAYQKDAVEKLHDV